MRDEDHIHLTEIGWRGARRQATIILGNPTRSGFGIGWAAGRAGVWRRIGGADDALLVCGQAIAVEVHIGKGNTEKCALGGPTKSSC